MNEVDGNKQYMDTDNPVVKLCMEGMEAESKGRFEAASKLFEQAWSACQDDYDACMAAHFLARHQDTPQAVFEWNQEALNRANLVGDDRVLSFYASLYLNLGHSYDWSSRFQPPQGAMGRRG